MADFDVTFNLDEQTPVNADFSLGEHQSIEANFSIDVKNGDHNLLFNRDLADQHPIKAITGLEDSLTSLSNDISAEENRAKGVEQELANSIDINHQAISNHVSDKNNPHEVTKSQIGLGDVDNTSDINKPISTATQNALNGKVDKVNTASRVYGTDASGNQTTYDSQTFGKVDDVQVGGVSVVTNKVAELGTMAGEDSSDYYTSGQVDTALASKQDVISDISTIRSNAQDGKTAYTTIQSYGNIVTHNADEFASAQQGSLADTALQPNDNISQLTNNVGYITNDALNGYATENYVDTGLNGKQDKLTQTQLDAVNSGANTTNIGQIATNTSDISSINALIPNQATISNQLADKSFVNSSINNMAAFYITSDVAGDPFATRASLIAGPYYFRGEIRIPTQNDYALVSEDETHDNLTSRYMYDGGQWVWQYTLNNTKFTQSQIDAINSGITNVLVDKISTNETAINNHIANKNNPHEVTKSQIGLGNVDNTSDLSKPISTATQTALNGKQDTISDLATIRSGAALGATAVQPSDLATVATSGNYDDLSNKPTIPTVPTNVSAFTNDAGYITNSALNGYATQVWVGQQGYITGITSSDVTTALGYTPVNPTSLSNVATSGDYDDLTNKPTIPTVNDATLTIQKNGTNIATFTSNSATATTANITVPTDTSDLTNGAGYITGITSGDVTGALGYTPIETITTGSANGSISVDGSNVFVYGLDSAAYTSSSNYATSAQGSLADTAVQPADLAAVATSGSYNDLSNKPTIPAAQVNSDWNAVSGVAKILNKPSLAKVATSGSYNDLSNKPTIPTVNNPKITLTQGGTVKGSFTLNQKTGATIDFDAESSGGYYPDLLSFQWSDHLLNNVSWLRADTFSWQDGTVYAAAYQHLLNDITSITPTTETVGSNTITVYTATDGHKIVLANQAQIVQDIYNETGVSWYFILDTTNQRFKLPRTKFGFTGLRDTVGKYVSESLPNIKGGGAGEIGWTTANTPTGAFYKDKESPNINGSFASRGGTYSLGFDASRSSSIYQDNATVQQRATQMYLYFYVGDYTQTALEQTAGLNAELFNDKLDTSTFNTTPHIVETYKNGTSWYRIWSDGWCEQGGYANTNATSVIVTFLKPFIDTNYNRQVTIQGTDGNYNYHIITAASQTGITIFAWKPSYWQACGYIS